MKVAFFRHLLEDRNTSQWTAAQQIVYSHLLSQSILRTIEAFSKDGTSIDYLELLDLRGVEQELDLCDYKVAKLSTQLNLSRQNVYDCLMFLQANGYVHNGEIYCPEGIISHGYFELRTDTGLSKQLLIFYSWLVERGKDYNNIVDTYVYRMAQLFNTNNNNIKTLIHRLSEKGFVKRVRDGRKGYGKLLIL